MRAALHELGHKAYHMSEALENNDFALWFEYFAHGHNVSALKHMLATRGYSATLDFPACLLYKVPVPPCFLSCCPAE
jgi:hypothetical protein